MDYNEKFNETFCEFMQDLIRVFPDDYEFRMYELAIKSTMLYYPTYVAETFRERVSIPYGDRILERDDTFFLSHDYEDVKKEHQEANAVIEKVKNCYTTMSQENKDIVWKYFRVLTLLANRIST